MIHKFRDILEHDMDMLILEEFACSTEFSKIFLNKVKQKIHNLMISYSL